VSTPPGTALSRRTLLVGAGTATLAAALGGRSHAAAGRLPGWSPFPGTSLARVTNPLVRQRADTQILRHGGRYYLTASVPEYDRLVLRSARTVAGLATAPETVVWRRPASGPMAGHIWAPEIHHIDGRWYFYFAAGDSDDVFRIRTYVLESSRTRDPRDARWTLLGKLATPWESFTLDSTTFVHRGTRYLAWAQREPGIDTNSNLYIAPLATPTTLGSAPVRIAVPTLPWEIQGFRVNEGPAVLIRNGRVFMTYSASATDARYAMGLLIADADADLLDPASWAKSPEPVFATSVVTSAYGPGHNSFTVDESGADLLVYHAREYRDIVGDPLYDPNRHTFVQRLYWKPDGTPDFGIPVGSGPLPVRLGTGRGTYVSHVGARVVITAAGRIEASQFRLRDGLAGAGTTSLEPIDAPGRFLRRTRDNRVVLAADDGSAAFADQASFIRRPGLAHPAGTSWEAYRARGSYLKREGGDVRVGRADRERATFFVR
jgi:GH43 family beta-xylosidase